VVASATGVPLLGAYIGVLVSGVIGFLMFFLGMGIGRIATRIICRFSALADKRVVTWT
jgi:high-affinity Fe2+/Pb2+ permease